MIVLAIVIAASSAVETPRRFIERVYASYQREDFSPLTHPESIFAPSLVTAIREDQRLSRGEVGYLDGDPLCQCQDTGGMRPRISSVTRTDGTATARISIRFDSSGERWKLGLRLVRIKSGWRISDVMAADEPSLLRDLQTSNRRQRRKR